MTSLQSAPRRRRALAAAGAVSAGLLVLSACDKPTPVSTVTVGDSSVNSEALCYNGDKTLTPESLAECAKKTGDVKTISVDPAGDTVRVGVDPKIADAGWVLLVNGRQFTDVSKKTYSTIPGSAFFNAQYGTQGDTNTLSVQMGTASSARGVWSFKLKKAA
ncbi:DUF2771 domain-containing protein [Streptomyces sp. NPDC058459]|uniref:DUF2771 domain-containing protein n=1 Tax=Streptomyces sp. NPDC058459 TaxID=3346508 RepID=UPI00365A01CD